MAVKMQACRWLDKSKHPSALGIEARDNKSFARRGPRTLSFVNVIFTHFYKERT